MHFTPFEIEETRRMFQEQHLDVRTVTVGISLYDCVSDSLNVFADRVYDKIHRVAGQIRKCAQDIESIYGVPIVNTRVSLTPLALVSARACNSVDDFCNLARRIDEAATSIGIDFIGGCSALVHKGTTEQDDRLIAALPEMLAETKRLCASLSLASSAAGINVDAVVAAARVILKSAKLGGYHAPSRFVGFANVPDDNPFMAGAFHGVGEGESAVHVGVSGPGAVLAAVRAFPDAPLHILADAIKRTAFKITRLGQLVANEAARRLQIPAGIVDLSLAPTPTIGDSVARILESIGVAVCGAPGTTMALALLNTAIKKGGMMASTNVGGLSGSFLPVSEDEGMAAAVASGILKLEKLEALTSVCSVGLDMIAVPGDISEETLAGIIGDEMAIGVVNHKTTAVRIIPAEGKKPGEWIHIGGLLGEAPVMAISQCDQTPLVKRGGRIPPPITAFKN